MSVVRRAGAVSISVILLVLWCRSLPAASVEDLDPDREWRLRSLTIRGNERFSTRELRELLTTIPREWYVFWRSLPDFEPDAFREDLERLARFYESQGHYEAKIDHELTVEPETGVVAAAILIYEGEPVRVERISLEVLDAPELEPELKSHLPTLPLKEEEIFTEEAYQETEARIREFLFDRSRARADVKRKAEVILEPRRARAYYLVEAGPESLFGPTAVEGLREVEEYIVTRELAYEPGDPFSGRALRRSERNLRQLELFSIIRFRLLPSPVDPAIVPIELQLEERPPREVRVGLGYGTEDQLRGQIRWRHNNWLGGARRLELGVKASFIAREIEVNFLQPHFLSRKNRLLLNFRPHQLDEPGFFLNATRLHTRIERRFSDALTGFVGHRAEYNHLARAPSATLARLRDFETSGFLLGVSTGLLWDRSDDRLNPTRGWALSFIAEQVGGFLGGDFDFFKLQGEARGYYPLPADIVFASRLRLGWADPFGRGREVPLYERFYAGGAASVRGYGRHRLGPLSAADDPLGGRSLIEGSIELRRLFTQTIGAVLFLDFGQASLRSFDIPIDDLRFSAGFGIQYITPVGPLRLDIGFPFRPPRGDPSWRIHFTIGQFF